MIGKPEWFRRRKYSGWGFTPVTWQGWVYTLCAIAPIMLILSTPTVNQLQIGLAIVWALIACADFIHITINLPRDERDRIHEAFAERNALWVIITVLAVGVAYQAASGAVQGIVNVDPVIIAALVLGLVTKMVSNIYLDKRD